MRTFEIDQRGSHLHEHIPQRAERWSWTESGYDNTPRRRIHIELITISFRCEVTSGESVTEHIVGRDVAGFGEVVIAEADGVVRLIGGADDAWVADALRPDGLAFGLQAD